MNEETLFAEAVEKKGEARAAFLDQHCQDNPALRQRLEILLRANDCPDPELEPGATRDSATLDDPTCERPGTIVSGYKLIEQIGEGGFGIVFMAEQQKPVRRKVALKILKPGMDTRQVVARFEAERQALAMMSHPNIAKVHDAGATPSGRPFFVMELVHGIPITDYCDKAGFTIRQRLELFVQVCRAVQHAHHNGVIHRDLKPGNVLVTSRDGVPFPMLIDFGIAKAMGRELTDRTLVTGFAQMIGTPLYMSPEQAELNQFGVDTRSDIYSLGVLLYELLTGTTPFEKDRLHQAGYDEMRRIIREEEPPRPSTRLSTLGANLSTVSDRRGVDPRKLSSEVRGELDWIVLRALEKDRNRRYETAGAFAADVERYLKDEPVEACPPTTVYRARKLIRRHKTRLITVALPAAVLLLGGIGFICWREVQATATAQAVAQDLKEEEILRNENQWAKAVHALERATLRLQGSGLKVLEEMVLKRKQEATFVEALTRIRLHGDSGLDGWAADQAYRSLFAENGLNLTVLPANEVAKFIDASPIRDRLVKALDNWAFLRDLLPGSDSEQLRAITRLVDNDSWRQRLRAPRIRTDGPKLLALAEENGALMQPSESLIGLFFYLVEVGQREAGLRLLKKVQEQRPTDFSLNEALGFFLANDPATASDAIGYCRASLVAEPNSSSVWVTLGNALHHLKRDQEAETVFLKVIALRPHWGPAYVGFGDNQIALKRFEKAEQAYRQATELDHGTLACLTQVWQAYREAGRFQDALRLAKELVDTAKRRLGSEGDVTLTLISNLGVSYSEVGRLEDAIPLYEHVLEKRQESLGPNCRKTLLSMNNLATAYRDVRRLEEAIALRQQSLEAHTTNFGPDDPETLNTMQQLAFDYEDAGRLQKQSELLLELLGHARKKGNLPKQITTHGLLSGLGLSLLKQERYAAAELLLRECVSIREKDLANDWRRFNAISLLGGALAGQKKYEEAEPLLCRGYHGMKEREKDTPQVRLTEAAERLAQFYQATGQVEKARSWQDKLAAARHRAKK